MIHVHLSEGQRGELEAVSRHAVGRVALRAQMVLLSDRGFPVPQIARVHDCGVDVVRTWLHRYAARGVAGLDDAPRGDRPRKDALAPHIVDAQASQSPAASGHVQTTWTVALLTAFLATRFGLALSGATVRRLLAATGWRWARPRLAPASALRRKRDPDADAKRAAIAAARREAAAGRARLLSLDECDLHLLPVVRALGMKGPRARIPTPGTNAKRAFFGALDAMTGAFHWADRERKLAVHFVAFLRNLAAAYPTGRLILVLDNVRMHAAKVVRAWLAANPRVTLRWLPRYAAHEANPVERIWGLLKGAVAADRLAGSIDDLTRAARRFLTQLPPHPLPLPEAA